MCDLPVLISNALKNYFPSSKRQAVIVVLILEKYITLLFIDVNNQLIKKIFFDNFSFQFLMSIINSGSERDKICNLSSKKRCNLSFINHVSVHRKWKPFPKRKDCNTAIFLHFSWHFSLFIVARLKKEASFFFYTFGPKYVWL